MKETPEKRPFDLYLLILLVFFQALSGLAGGFSLIIDPSGERLYMPAEKFLVGTPFNDYLIPGIILGFLLGIFPLIVFIGLLRRPNWPWADALNPYSNRHWAWAFSLYMGIMLVIWIDVQVMMIGYQNALQSIYAFVGITIVILTLLPAVMRYFRKD